LLQPSPAVKSNYTQRVYKSAYALLWRNTYKNVTSIKREKEDTIRIRTYKYIRTYKKSIRAYKYIRFYIDTARKWGTRNNNPMGLGNEASNKS
jgi:hypothetical protein